MGKKAPVDPVYPDETLFEKTFKWLNVNGGTDMSFKKIVAVMVILLLAISVLPGVASAKENTHVFKAIPAKDIELVKKGTVHGHPGNVGGGKKPSAGIATGVLGTPCNGNKYAVIVGISDYPGTSNDLEYCDDDALSVEDVLINVYGFPSENVITLLNSQATAQNILDAVNTIKDSEVSGDEVVFFFSGHGAKSVADDGDKEKIDESIVCWGDGGTFAYIWDGQLKDWFSGFDTSRIIFLFDSCLSGGMTDLAAPGRIINMASTESGYSYELDSLQHGEFTYYFVLKGIEEGKADIYDHNGDDILNQSADVVVEEAFDYTKANCQYDKPTISDSFTDDLHL
jgi:metacaspase-1